MSPRWWMFLGFLWIGSQLIGGMIEGVYWEQADTVVIEEMTEFRILNNQGMMGFPVMGTEFFTKLPQLVSFKYSFVTGGFIWMRFFCMCFTFGIIWAFIQTFLPPLLSGLGRFIPWGN